MKKGSCPRGQFFRTELFVFYCSVCVRAGVRVCMCVLRLKIPK